MIDGAARHRIDSVPTFAASAVPSGTITRGALDAMRDALVSGLRHAAPVDAVCLALQGAGAADGIDDIESYILRGVREAIGTRVPLIATLDLHANMTQEMLERADTLLGVHCYPHTDSFDCGAEGIIVIRTRVSGRR
jgi:microcystin degradation protein MlrC